MIFKSDAGGRMMKPVERQVELVQEFEVNGFSVLLFAAVEDLKCQTSAT